MKRDGEHHITADQWHRLECRFQALAKAEASVYLPNSRPVSKVDFVFVATEPSLGHWARDADTATERVRAGFQNFMWSIRDFLVQHVFTRRISDVGQTYHLTDLTKGAMSVERASSDRLRRYDRWFPTFQEELALVRRPETRVVTIGRSAAGYLDKRSEALGVTEAILRLPHYSGQAAGYHLKCARAHCAEFQAFGDGFRKDEVLEYAAARMRETRMSGDLKSLVMCRLRRAKYGEALRALAFVYWREIGAVLSPRCASATPAGRMS